MIDLYNGDCLEEMDKLIAKGIIVDAIICDPPYGTTACKWDSVIDFNEMWLRLNKLIKPNGAIILFGSEPFSSALRMSNIKNYKYDLIWSKKSTTGFLNANRMPLRQHENINVFYKKQCTYNPQMREGKTRTKGGKKYANNGVYGDFKEMPKETYNLYHPTSIKTFSNANQKAKQHPTQKPVELMEYLIKTYTNENETVLDFTCGSGSTILACKNLNRNGIGIELDENYFNIAKERIDNG
tara:strand:+ start:3563 stop:4282 length:720 start_codon:yes stop_codon:yes gene_type:complete